MNSASSHKQTTSLRRGYGLASRLLIRRATASVGVTLAANALFVFAAAPATRAEAPESQLKLAGAIPLTTELFDKSEKFLTSVKNDAAAKAELAAVTKENKDNPPMTGEAWGSLISAKCPKTVEIFQASGLTPDEFGKAAMAIQAIILGDAMAPPGTRIIWRRPKKKPSPPMPLSLPPTEAARKPSTAAFLPSASKRNCRLSKSPRFLIYVNHVYHQPACGELWFGFDSVQGHFGNHERLERSSFRAGKSAETAGRDIAQSLQHHGNAYISTTATPVAPFTPRTIAVHCAPFAGNTSVTVALAATTRLPISTS